MTIYSSYFPFPIRIGKSRIQKKNLGISERKNTKSRYLGVLKGKISVSEGKNISEGKIENLRSKNANLGNLCPPLCFHVFMMYSYVAYACLLGVIIFRFYHDNRAS